MAIRPTDIRRKEFNNSFRGYDANHVNDFLNGIADEVERAYSENTWLREVWKHEALDFRLEKALSPRIAKLGV